MVVPTGGLMHQWLWISRVHPIEWLFNGDGMVLELMDLPSCLLDDGQWILVKLEFCCAVFCRMTFVFDFDFCRFYFTSVT